MVIIILKPIKRNQILASNNPQKIDMPLKIPKQTQNSLVYNNSLLRGKKDGQIIIILTVC